MFASVGGFFVCCAEILGALLSVLLIWLMTGILVYEAVFRVRNPEDVDGARPPFTASSFPLVTVLTCV